MSRFRATLPLALLVAPLFAQDVAHPQSDASLWRFVHPNAKAVIGIDWGHIRQSQAGTLIREKLIPLGALPGFPRLEFLDSVDRFLFSTPGIKASDDSQDDSPGSVGQTPLIVAVHGRFDGAQVRQLFKQLGAKPQAYN
jgi:hypothetical protein